MEQLPVPDLGAFNERLRELSDAVVNKANANFRVRSVTQHRMVKDLAPPERQRLSGKLENFWNLDFAAFRAEAKKVFKADLPVKDRDDWEKYLAEKSAEVFKITAELELAEREIDAIVYKLFDLTKDEIKLLEASLDGQY
jgi:hypothetical protein